MLTSLNWQKMTIICTVEELSSCPYKIHKLGRMYATAAPAPDAQTFITGKCLWNGRALINPFLCMQSWNAAFFLFFLLAICWGGDLGSGSGSKFNRAARVGSGQTISGTGRIRASVLSPCRPLITIRDCTAVVVKVHRSSTWVKVQIRIIKYYSSKSKSTAFSILLEWKYKSTQFFMYLSKKVLIDRFILQFYIDYFI